MTKKIELQELISLGLSERASRAYSESDYTVYLEDDGLLTIKLGSEPVSHDNTIRDINAFFKIFESCELKHIEGKGFILVAEDGGVIASVDIDWTLVEDQANELGHTLY